MKLFFELLERHRKEYISIIILGAIFGAVESFFHPILLKLIFDESVIKKNFHKFVIFTFSYLVLGLVINVLTFVRSLWLKSFENRSILELSGQLLNKFYELDYREVSKNGFGYYISRVFTDVNEGFAPMLYLFDRLLNKVVSVIVFVGIMFYLSWKASLLMFIVSPFFVYFSNKIGGRIREITRFERENQGIFLSSLEKFVRAFRMIRSFKLFDISLKIFSEKLGLYLNFIFENFKLSNLYDTLSYIVMNIADFLSLFIGAFFVIKGELTFGGYLAFVNTFWRTLTSVNSFFYEIPRIQKYDEILKRIENFKKLKREKYFLPSQNVEVKNMNFSYDGKVIFKNLNLTIKKGERLCIKGRNGSGKTTLSHIISGYLKPDSGEVKLPSRIASITLPLHFPPVKIKYLNIRKEIAEKLMLRGWEDKFAEKLSAGQKLKLGIALSLSTDAELYVFDEPLANVDEASKKLVIDTIMEYTKGKTLVVIMHGNEEFYEKFDRVINIEDLTKSGGVK